MNESEIARALFAATRDNIPSATKLAHEALANSKFGAMGATGLKNAFSEAVSSLQVDAYQLYLENEKEHAGAAILKVFSPIIAKANDNLQALEAIAANFGALDKFSLSLTQSRRSRAGTAFEVIVSELFSRLGYPYSAQADVHGSSPDYVLPSIEWYLKFPSDSIIFTLKRTLRERWRQIVTESSSGKFYLATIDENVSGPGLAQMMQRNISLVVPADVKTNNYANKLNVISFEDFFDDHLDPAMLRWRKAGAI
jgi:hypothetical protein